MVQHRRAAVVRVAAWYRIRGRFHIRGEFGEGSCIGCTVRAHALERFSGGDSSCSGRVRASARSFIKRYSEWIRIGSGGFAHLRERSLEDG